MLAGEWFSELAGCLDSDPANDPMAAENAFQSLIRDRSIAVEVSDAHMTWVARGVTLFFEWAEAPPSGQPAVLSRTPTCLSLCAPRVVVVV